MDDPKGLFTQLSELRKELAWAEFSGDKERVNQLDEQIESMLNTYAFNIRKHAINQIL